MVDCQGWRLVYGDINEGQVVVVKGQARIEAVSVLAKGRSLVRFRVSIV